MKSILIIGLGRFGRHLCRKFMSLNNEVMIVDRDEAAVSALADNVTSAQIADCTDENALRALGVQNFDICFVCIGSDFASSLLITSMLKDMGAAHIIAKAVAGHPRQTAFAQRRGRCRLSRAGQRGAPCDPPERTECI